MVFFMTKNSDYYYAKHVLLLFSAFLRFVPVEKANMSELKKKKLVKGFKVCYSLVKM